MNKELINGLWRQVTALIEEVYPIQSDQERIVKNLQNKLSKLSDDEKIENLKAEIEELEKFKKAQVIDGDFSTPAIPSLLTGKVWGCAVVLLLAAILGVIWLAFSFVGNDSKKANATPETTTVQTTGSSQTASSATLQSEVIYGAKGVMKWSDLEEFEVIEFGKNAEGKVIEDNSSNDSLTGTPEQKIAKILKNAEHKVQALEGYAIQFGAKIPKNILWVESKNGKNYLSKQAQTVWYQLQVILASLKAENVDDVGVSAVAGGVSKGEFVQDTAVRNYQGWDGVKFTAEDGGVFYCLNYCGNPLFPQHVPNVPKKNVPIPPSNPTPPSPKPDNGVTTTTTGGKTPPPSTPPTTPQTTVPSNDNVVAKKSANDPVNQGNASTGGGARQDAGVVPEAPSQQAPSFPQTYQAPQNAPQTSSGNFGATGGGNAAISNQNEGNFTDSNGKTVISSNGAVSTPQTTYGELVNQTPPPVQNGNSGNSETNNGYANANDIPMED